MIEIDAKSGKPIDPRKTQDDDLKMLALNVLALIAGTLSLNVHAYIAGESFILRTPTDNFQLRYPDVSRVRINSYLDGISITPQDDATVRLPDVPSDAQLKGQTFWFHEGHRIPFEGSSNAASFASWDTWVADRISQRKTAIADVMTAAGLTSPVPALADMAGHGICFACPLYGTCWEPTANKYQQKVNDMSKGRPAAHDVNAVESAPHFVEASLIERPSFSMAKLIGSDPIDP